MVTHWASPVTRFLQPSRADSVWAVVMEVSRLTVSKSYPSLVDGWSRVETGCTPSGIKLHGCYVLDAYGFRTGAQT
jgi:hypothetical protein